MPSAISISLPDELIERGREVASDQHTSLDDVISIALQREFERRKKFATMIREGNEWGRKAGITSEEDVERIANGDLSLAELKRTA